MSSLEDRLNRSRKELLDLTTSNPLLSMPIKGSKILPALAANSQAVFETLYIREKPLSFKGISTNAKGKFSPNRFHAELTREKLSSKLKVIRREARTLVQECAVNFLFITLGSLEWIDTEGRGKGKRSRAPLILIPVTLNHDRGSDEYTATWQNDEVQENVCLLEMLRVDHGLEMPSFRIRDKQEETVTKYVAELTKALRLKTEWKIHEDDVRLGIFNPNNMLIYRDLDPETWIDSEGEAATSLPALLNIGHSGPNTRIALGHNLDDSIDISRLDHVVDADSSQAIAIERVRAGENIVIQGPPGTGKSQTITNIIATAVLDGKSVLFVAEKQTALEVVRKNMEAAGLGRLCMMLGQDSKKTSFLEDIKSTWDSASLEPDTPFDLLHRLDSTRRVLNTHARDLHSRLGGLDETPFAIAGQLALGSSLDVSRNPVTIPESTPWTKERFEECLEATRELVRTYNSIIPPRINPWKGVRKKHLVARLDIPTIRGAISILSERISALGDGAKSVATTLEIHSPLNLGLIAQLGEAANLASTAPDIALTELPPAFWNSDHEPLAQLIELGKECLEWRRLLDLKVKPEAYREDFSDDASKIRLFGNSFRSWLVPSYRKSISRISGFMLSPLPWSHDEKLRLLDDIVAAQQKIRALEESNDLGTTAFGTLWRGLETDWKLLAAIIDWVRICEGKGLLLVSIDALARIRENNSLTSWGLWLTETSTQILRLFSELGTLLEFRSEEVFGIADLKSIGLREISAKLSVWEEAIDSLAAWCGCNAAKGRMESLNLAQIANQLESDLIPSTSVADSLITSHYRKLLEKAWNDYPDLASFNGNMHAATVRNFGELDKARIRLARHNVLTEYHSKRRSQDISDPEARYIIPQFGKKKNILPIRELMRHSGNLIRSIKPVFMMSPLSVARYLERGRATFDLMIIDEASQMPPVEALGTAARCTQHVVVGDSKQLPPSTYFKRNAINDELDLERLEDEEEEVLDSSQDDLSDMESILELCNSRGLANTMLMGHYRSRHPSLIGYSNARFYDQNLSVVPSPSLLSNDLGLKFRPVDHGVYFSKKGNPAEAETVAQAIIDHYNNPRGRSLGVITLNEIQQKLIIAKLKDAGFSIDDLNSRIPDHDGREPFDIWTIEKVQGHERDVIFISVGYGPDDKGNPPTQNFGFISRKGGERRLNVMITRAKYLCMVFSSLKSGHIQDSDMHPARMAFKGFIKNAEQGGYGFQGLRSEETKGLNPLVASIESALSSLHYKCERNIGTSEFKIDIAVLDPEQPGRFLIGILTDGETYRSARSARDRDRLREAVLKSNGWNIHRIWSLDWLKDPEACTESLREVLEQVIARSQPVRNPASIDARMAFPECGEYTIATPTWRKGPDLENIQPSRVAKLIRDIVSVEGPIHPTVLKTRIKKTCGIVSLRGETIRAIENASRICIQDGSIVEKNGFLEAPGTLPMIRNRSQLGTMLPRAEFTPPSEIRLSVESILRDHPAIELEDLVKAVAKLLGYSPRNITLAGSVETEIEQLRQANLILLRSRGLA